MNRLIVKHFGPLKDIDIELNKINLLIGENGSGKSVLAKLITIFHDFPNLSSDEILKKIKDFNIDFITKDTIIRYYENDNILVELTNKQIKINAQLEKFTTTQYIPAERNLISLFSKSLTTLLVAEVPLPKFLLKFSSEFEKATNEIKELDFLNVKYINSDGLDRHKVYFNDTDYLSLEHSSSGIQSALPLYLTVKYFANRHHSIIIEEPEQNLFPKAQKETIQYIIEQMREKSSLFFMTHSPYILSTLNILIFAYKVAQLSEEIKEQVKERVKEEQWINPDDFVAYYLEDGTARNIKSSRGLISDNEIDNISDDIAEEFDILMEIYRDFKYAK